MDATVWLGKANADTRAREERQAFRTAILLTLASVVFSFGFVLLLSAAGLSPTVLEEFPSAQVDN